MPERIFQICGATVPPMVGRKALMEHLLGALTKATPDHLQLVGPRFAGKSVVLTALAERMSAGGSPFGAVVLWDLGHQTPSTDLEFMCGLRDQLVVGLAKVSPEFAEYLREVNSNPYKELVEVFDELKGKGIKVLMLWDGFDKPLASGKLSRNLWDQLRELASRSSLRLVVASRQRLHQLIRDPESMSSDFWGIFDMAPVRVECFDDRDIDEVLKLIPGAALDVGAKTELLNWTGAFPPLVLSILNDAHEAGMAGPMKPEAINACATRAIEGVAGLIAAMWSDCDQGSRDLFQQIVAARGSDANGLNPPDLAQLTEKGFAKRVGSKVVTSCRYLEKHIATRPGELGAIARLFGAPENFRENCRYFMERRLGQIKTIDPMIKGFIENSLRSIPDQPAICIGGVRGIVDRALDLIWVIELGPDKKIPLEYFAYWKAREERGAEMYWDEKFPTRRGHQIRLLQLITGTERSSPRAKFVSKNTYALANAAHGFGDFGQHIEGAMVDLGTAIAALMVCLELAASVDRELREVKSEK